MKTTWTSGVKDAQQKDEIGQAFKASALLRERLAEILDKKQMSNYRKRTSEGGYESPNWALEQADAVGYERALREVISLLK